MWSAFRSDFKEFVATVTEDTSQVLSKLDSNFERSVRQKADDDDDEEDELTPEMEEALRRMTMEETFTAELVLDDEEGPEELQEMAQFLESFSIEAKTDEIAQALAENPDTLKVHFERLVPTTVGYPEFWQRYYYRCDPERIARQWAAQEARDRQARQEAVSASISSVRNFLGGAVKAVSVSLSEQNHTSGGNTDDGLLLSGDITTTALGIFGNQGRPPFVMNTAVDEDDDDGAPEEEEELGWDDEEEDEQGKGLEDDSGHIEFKDAATERLQEELRQALEERDQLHQTVEMQSKEIVALKSGGAGDVYQAALQKLEMQLFEKESELAAVKEKLLDSTTFEGGNQPLNKGDDDRVVALEKEVEKLKAEVATKDSELNEMQTVLQGSMQQLDQLVTKDERDRLAMEKIAMEKTALEAKLTAFQYGSSDDQTDVALLQEKCSAMENELTSLRNQNDSLQKELAASINAISELEDQLKRSQEAIAVMTSQIHNTTAELKVAEKRAIDLEDELRQNKQGGVQQPAPSTLLAEEEEAAVSSAESPDTTATGVKVDKPVVTRTGGEEDGWDDDW